MLIYIFGVRNIAHPNSFCYRRKDQLLLGILESR